MGGVTETPQPETSKPPAARPWRLHLSDIAFVAVLASGVLSLLLQGGGQSGARSELIRKGWLREPVDERRDAAGKLIGNVADLKRHMCDGAPGEAARLFLKAGFSPNAGDGALLLATTGRGCLEAMRVLLDAGADANAAPSSIPGLLLFAAAHKENREGLKLLLERGARLDARLQPKVAAALLKAESSAMEHWANPVEDTIAFLETLKIELRATGEKGDSLLHIAVREENAAAVRALLERGADPAKANDAGEVPWLLAADLFLSDSGCRRADSGVSSPWKAKNPQRDARLREALQHILSRVPDLEQRDAHGRTLAFYLTRDLPLLREYLAKGLRFDAIDRRFMTPWDVMPAQDLEVFAAERPELARLPVMKKGGARTLLHVAVARPDVTWRLVDRLLASGYAPDTVDGFGDTPLTALFYGPPWVGEFQRRVLGSKGIWGCASERYAKHEDSSRRQPAGGPADAEAYVMERLLKAGANPNHTTPDGRFPLMMTERPATAALLLSHGADPRAKIEGKSLEEFFLQRGPSGSPNARELADLVVKARQRSQAGRVTR